jgi:hypothetical protein
VVRQKKNPVETSKTPENQVKNVFIGMTD